MTRFSLEDYTHDHLHVDSLRLRVIDPSLGLFGTSVLHDYSLWALKGHHQSLHSESNKAWHQHLMIWLMMTPTV